MVNTTDMRRAVCNAVTGHILLGTLGWFLVESGVASHHAVFWRCFFGAIVLTFYCAFTGIFRGTSCTARTLWLAFGGGACMVINWVLFFEAIRITWIGFATIVYHAQPFWILLTGILLLREPVSVPQTIWTAIAFAGFLLALNVLELMGGDNDILALGAFFAVLASLFYTATIFMTRAIGQALKPQFVAWVHTITGIVLLAPLMSFAIADVTASQWGWLIGLGAIHTGLVYVLLYSALPKLNPALIAVLVFIYPATSLLVDFVVYEIDLTPIQVIGLLLIATGTLGVGGIFTKQRSL